MELHIGIVGDYLPDYAPHQITDEMLANAASASGIEMTSTWIPTDRVTEDGLQELDALWISPGSPYRGLDGALTAIRFARERNVPLGGACAGFQHMILEYARNVLGYADAVHAEYDPPAGGRVILDRLVCRVAGVALPITLASDSLAAKVYGRDRIVERYYCQYGLNPEYRHRLGSLRVSGWDENDEARVVELPGHRFFLATLFVPQSTAEAHPIATALLEAALRAQAAGSRLSLSQRTELLRRFRRGAEILAEAITGAAGPELDFKPYGKWSVRQIVCHLADGEATAVMRFRQMLAEENPTMPAWDQDAWAAKLDYDNREISQALKTFRMLRAENYELLKDKPEQAFERTGTHTKRGQITLLQLLRMYAEHTEDHVKQIQGVRAAYKPHTAKLADNR